MADDDESDDFDKVNKPDEAQSLEAWKRDAALPAESFARLHRRAVLLLQRARKVRLQTPQRPQKTLASRGPILQTELPPTKYIVFPIRKTERSLIARFYSVGQTRTNDVVIRDV